MAVNFYKETLNGEVIGVYELAVDDLIELQKTSKTGAEWEEITEEEYEQEIEKTLLKNEQKVIEENKTVHEMNLKTILMNWTARWKTRPTVQELEDYFQWYKE